MRRIGIAGKIWRTIGLFAAGTLVSLAVSQLASIRAERRLQVTSDALFPAARNGQQAEAAFERMARSFQDAILLEEASMLARGREEGLTAARALSSAAGVVGLDAERSRSLTRLSSDVASFARDAESAYGPMLAAGDNLTPEMNATSRALAERNAALRKAVGAASEQLAADLRSELSGAVRASTSQRWLSLFLFCGALALCALVVTFTIRRAIVRPIRLAVVELTTSARRVTDSSNQVARSSQSLAQGSTEQAASLEETSASMEEMAAMTRKNAENSQSAAALMGELHAQVDASNQALTDMVGAMASIQESSRQVAKIIKTIDEIAFQTNILALNAAVEAARAGEAGMGFAVVADEVRNLAQRSAQAAKDTASWIEASIGKAQDGNRRVEQLAAAISGIVGGISSVKALVDDVSSASRQQTIGIDQVSQAIVQMESVTQRAAATAEEGAAASKELSAQAETSMIVVHKLDALVGSEFADENAVAPGPVQQRIAAVAETVFGRL